MPITTLREIIRAETLVIPGLLPMLGDGADSLFPRAGATPGGSSPTPLIVAKYGAEVGDILRIAGFSFWVYDDPRFLYWNIEEIVHKLSGRFGRLLLPATADGYTKYFQTRHESTSGDLTDPSWLKNFKTVRFSVWGM